MSEGSEANVDSNNTKWKSRLDYVQGIVSVLALTYLIAASFGALLLFLYFLRHQFNPGGISAGDTLSLALLLLGFVVVLSLGLAVGTLAAYPLLRLAYLCVRGYFACARWFLRERLCPESDFAYSHLYGFPRGLLWKQAQEGFWLVCGTVILFVFVAAAWILPVTTRWFMVTVLMTGGWLCLFVFADMHERYSRIPRLPSNHPLDRWMNRQPEWVRKWTAAFAVAAAVQMLSLGMWQDASWTAVGFRERDASVRLAREDFDEVVEQAALSGIAVNPCTPIDASSAVIQHVDVLWQNFGAKSLARFPTQEFGADPNLRNVVRIEPESAKMIVVAARRTVSCSEFLSDVLFSQKKGLLRAGGTAQLVQQLQWLHSLDETARVRVVAHTTSDRLQGADGNTTAKDAELVKALLWREFGLPPARIDAMGAGDELPKRECKSALKTMQMQCERINRRVEVYLVASD